MRVGELTSFYGVFNGWLDHAGVGLRSGLSLHLRAGIT